MKRLLERERRAQRESAIVAQISELARSSGWMIDLWRGKVRQRIIAGDLPFSSADFSVLAFELFDGSNCGSWSLVGAENNGGNSQ